MENSSLVIECPRQTRSGQPVVLRALQWLCQHRLELGFITAGYLIFIITAHDLMQQPAYWVQGKLGSHRSWNNLVAAVAIPSLIAFCIWVIRGLRGHARLGIATIYIAITVLLCAVFFFTLLCMNIEAIHFPQYAILAVLIFALTSSFAQTIVWATLAALLDEGYQYLVLYPDRRIYMDFNDVILNTLGAGFGLVTLYAFGVTSETTVCGGQPRRFWRSKAAIATALVIVTAISLYAVGRLHVLAPKGSQGWGLVLRRAEPPATFWSHISWGKTFHEVLPWEWLIVTVALLGFYGLLDKLKAVEVCP